ncbi:hypothetical protein EG68_04786 [Paragonimus skrjabini miyazakii]|uniref:Scavenger receptor class B member 1 n=1 Tax=Paragonimus skrjabini miyazakii TaxID=59628 RepID=A0A8S9YSM6_9TREM|nr:hypothetical protein EG68_04786 [Paragonimus skrjabini miyazakii]
MRRKASRLEVTLIVSAVVFILLALVSFILLLVFDRLFLSLLAKKLVLQPGSPLFDNWLKPSVPILFKVYLLNLTNADEVLAGGRPHFQEVGPFVYRETRDRYDVDFLNDVQPQYVKITTPDLYYLGLVAQSLTFMDEDRPPFITLTAEQVMWGYYPSLLLEWSGKKVGLFSTHNGTNVNEFLVDVGAENIQDIGKIYEVDGKKKLKIWDYDEANMINGTDGSLAPPGMEVGSTVTFHVPDICRSSTLYANDKKPTINRKDIEVVVFSGAPADPTDPLAEWRSRMFCKTKSGCPPKGLVALAPCLSSKGVKMPMFLSQPSFIGADPQISGAFDGLPTPDLDKHVTTVHIEPTTGFLLEAFKRVQFNVYMNSTTNIVLLLISTWLFEPRLLTMFHLSSTAIADKKSLDEIYNRILLPRKRMPIILSVVSAIATMIAVTILLSLAICVRSRTRSRRSKRNATMRWMLKLLRPVTSHIGLLDRWLRPIHCSPLGLKRMTWRPLLPNVSAVACRAFPLLLKYDGFLYLSHPCPLHQLLFNQSPDMPIQFFDMSILESCFNNVYC